MNATAQTFLEYSDGEHRYFADGRELLSVTTILDLAGLVSPYCKDEEARYRGSRVHEFTAADDVSPLDLRTVPQHLRGYLRAWRRFRSDVGFEPMLIEHRVDDVVNGYSGRFDRFGRCKGHTLPTLLDIKTSNSGAVPAYSRLQLTAYSLAFNPKKIFFRRVVVLRPDGRYNTDGYKLETFLQDKAEWLAILKSVKENRNGHVKGN